MSTPETREARLLRRIKGRDRKIAGLQREVQRLALALAVNQNTQRDLERAVTRALCNVRMIPVLGIGGRDKIVEVRSAKTEDKP